MSMAEDVTLDRMFAHDRKSSRKINEAVLGADPTGSGRIWMDPSEPPKSPTSVPIQGQTPIATDVLTKGPLGNYVTERLGHEVRVEDLDGPLGAVPMPGRVEIVTESDAKVSKKVVRYMHDKDGRASRERGLVPKFPCPYCGTRLDSSFNLTDKVGASPGDLSVCVECREVAAWTEDMRLRRISDVELAQAFANDRLGHVLSALRFAEIWVIDASVAVYCEHR